MCATCVHITKKSFKGMRFSRARVTDSYELPYMGCGRYLMWVLNSGPPLKEQQSLLTTDTSLQSPSDEISNMAQGPGSAPALDFVGTEMSFY